MPLRIVQSKQNARLKDLRRSLAHPPRESTGADPLQAETGPILAGIEGPKLLEEALHAGLRLRCVFAAQDAEGLLDSLTLPPDTEILLLPRHLLDSALATETPQSIAALVEPPQWSWDQVFATQKSAKSEKNAADKNPSTKKPLLLVLAGLQDPGNLGSILRSAEAFGATGVVSLPGTVSAWNPKAVRASAGSLFRLPLLAVSADECFERLQKNRVKLWTTAVHGAQPAQRADLAASAALIIGNEGNGVPAELAARADAAITIPCPGPVESLNASVAASILLYEAARQRSG